ERLRGRRGSTCRREDAVQRRGRRALSGARRALRPRSAAAGAAARDAARLRRRTPMSARLPYVETPPPELAAAYEEIRKATGRVLNFWKLMAHHVPMLPMFQAWYRTTREGPLDLKLRQLAYVRTAQLNRCGY